MKVTARRDPSLAARIIARQPLLYAEGADPSLDRPAHVRAGSSLARFGESLALVQDDANFLALIGPGGAVRALTLPVGEGGLRQFDDRRGNKGHKLDLEACAAVPLAGGTGLLALGSGSTPAREKVLLVQDPLGREPRVRLREAPELYRLLRASPQFSGSELNLEGAAFLGARLRLLGRGNGAARGDLRPVNATADLEWEDLRAYLEGESANPPALEGVLQYDLGLLGGQALGFTDGAAWRGSLLYCAAAEDSPDATRDGAVTGSAIGVIDPDGAARWALLTGPDGAVFPGKVEGIAAGGSGWLWAVLDADDPGQPSELCRVELDGPWLS